MKKTIGIGMALVLVLFLMTSCRVPQEEFDKVSSDLTAAETQIQSLQGDLSAKENELSAKESELATAQTEIQSLQGDLSTKENELSAKESELASAQTQIQSLRAETRAAKAKLDEGRARMEILNAIFIPAMTGELEGMTDAESVAYFFEWRDKIMDVEDPRLTAKFEALIEAFSDEAFLSFFVYLLESTADALE